MDLEQFTTAPCAGRRDGWSRPLKARFLDRLAATGNVRAASAAVGMSRDAAYCLRRRDALFARGWAMALVLARESRAEVLADRAVDGVEEDIWYRGELVGTRRKYDSRLLLAHIARLDKLVEEQAAGEDAARFDELLACIAGADVPEELECGADTLPIDREAFVDRADAEAQRAVEEAWDERDAEEGVECIDGYYDAERYAIIRAELEDAATLARAEAAARWDAWFTSACETVDAALARPEMAPAPPAVDAAAPPQPSAAPAEAAAGEETPDPKPAEQPSVSNPRTVSEVSASPPPGTRDGHFIQPSPA